MPEQGLPEGRRLHRGGTYLCMEGPAFSTRPSKLYRSWDCSVIGMTNHTEARLAREAEVAYASLSMVTDFDCWHEDHDAVSVEMVIGNLQANASATEPILSELMQRLKQDLSLTGPYSPRQCPDHPKDQVPEQTRSNLDLFTAPIGTVPSGLRQLSAAGGKAGRSCWLCC